MVLGDRSRGTNIAISFWASEEAMEASEPAVSQPCEEATKSAHFVENDPSVEGSTRRLAAVSPCGARAYC
jgi:hypothetical protein